MLVNFVVVVAVYLAFFSVLAGSYLVFPSR